MVLVVPCSTLDNVLCHVVRKIGLMLITLMSYGEPVTHKIKPFYHIFCFSFSRVVVLVESALFF